MEETYTSVCSTPYAEHSHAAISILACKDGKKEVVATINPKTLEVSYLTEDAKSSTIVTETIRDTLLKILSVV